MLIIAEVGQAHDGSLGNAHAFIDALANTGVNIIKFQTHIAEAERRVYADRSHLLGDMDFVNVPIDTLISKNYSNSL